jgi:hypothetical protein
MESLKHPENLAMIFGGDADGIVAHYPRDIRAPYLKKGLA